MDLEIKSVITLLELFSKLVIPVREFLRDIRFRRNKICYYIDNSTKSVTIYKNGHGIIINTLRLKILDKLAFNKDGLIRTIDFCNTTKKNVKLPPFEDMINADKINRFTDYGFWYQSTSNVMKHHVLIDEGTKKQLSFKLDLSVDIDEDEFIEFTYSFSIPGLFPISDGYFDIENALIETPFETSLNIENQINKFTYILSFEKGIKIQSEEIKGIIEVPKVNNGFIEEGQDVKHINDIFYNKFFFTKRFPAFQSMFKFTWMIDKNPYQGICPNGTASASSYKNPNKVK
jgi:hypothetical protein